MSDLFVEAIEAQFRAQAEEGLCPRDMSYRGCMTWQDGHRPLEWITQQDLDARLHWVASEYFASVEDRCPKMLLAELHNDPDVTFYTTMIDGVAYINLNDYMYDTIHDWMMTLHQG